MSASLFWSGFKPEDLIGALEESTAKTRRDAKTILRQAAKDIMTASQQMCPVDKHNLEDAHSIIEIRSNTDTIGLEIGVGGDVGGVNVDDYAMYMHEGLAPYGSGSAGDLNNPPKNNPKSGEKSREKNASNPPDRPVGGKFLERAAEIYEDQIIEKIFDALLGE